MLNSKKLTFCLVDDHLRHFIAGTDGVDHFKTFDYFSKAGMVTVEMGCVAAAVADEKLGTTGVAAGMRHRHYPSVVKLVTACEFAVDFITGSTRTCSGWVASLDYEIRNYTVEYNAVIKPFLGQRYKVLYCVWSIGIEKLDLHYPFFGVDFSGRHVGKFSAKMGIEIDFALDRERTGLLFQIHLTCFI